MRAAPFADSADNLELTRLVSKAILRVMGGKMRSEKNNNKYFEMLNWSKLNKRTPRRDVIAVY